MKYDFLNIFTENSDNSVDYYKRALRAAVEERIKLYDDEDNSLKDETVKKVFEKCNSNIVSDVLAKVTILNYFYSTQLKSYPITESEGDYNITGDKKYHMDVLSMAHHIASCSEFDEWISNGALDAVRYIRKGHGQYRKNYHMEEYSFATKYCSFCASNDQYPIVDSYTKDVLYYLNQFLSNKGCPFHKPGIKRSDLEDYSKYCNIYQDLKKYLMLSGEVNLLPNKEVDKFLWHYGKYPEK